MKETIDEWFYDKVPRLAAALAYYAVFSIPPILVIAIAIAGFFYGPAAAEGHVVGQLEDLVGTRGAQAIQVLLARANHRSQGLIATAVGVVTLFFGATGFFAALHEALNEIWHVEREPHRGIKATLRRRLGSFLLVLATAALLLVSLLADALLGAFAGHIEAHFPLLGLLYGPLTTVFGFALSTLVFMLLFKVIPDVDVAWRDVWIGAVATAGLFVLGRWGLRFYFARGAFASMYGAAGSLIVILVWIYFSAQIIFLGAEFTQVYSRRRGSHQARGGEADSERARAADREAQAERAARSAGGTSSSS